VQAKVRLIATIMGLKAATVRQSNDGELQEGWGVHKQE